MFLIKLEFLNFFELAPRLWWLYPWSCRVLPYLFVFCSPVQQLISSQYKQRAAKNKINLLIKAEFKYPTFFKTANLRHFKDIIYAERCSEFALFTCKQIIRTKKLMKAILFKLETNWKKTPKYFLHAVYLFCVFTHKCSPTTMAWE